MRFPGHFTRRFLNSKRLCQKQIQPLAQFLFAGHVPIFHMVDAMGQSRPSLCQCCTASSGATGGNSAELMRLENFEEIWKIFTHFYPPLHHTDPLYSVTVRRWSLAATDALPGALWLPHDPAISCRLLPSARNLGLGHLTSPSGWRHCLRLLTAARWERKPRLRGVCVWKCRDNIIQHFNRHCVRAEEFVMFIYNNLLCAQACR